MKKPYLLDKTPVDGDELIKKAEEYGYTGDEYGILYTSGAAAVLRKHGHIVERNLSTQNKEDK